MATTSYSVRIGETKLIDITMYDANDQLLDIGALTFLRASILQSGNVIESMELFPEGDDPRIRQADSVLTFELTKAISKKLKPGAAWIKITTNNPDEDFTEDEEHIDIEYFEAFKVLA